MFLDRAGIRARFLFQASGSSYKAELLRGVRIFAAMGVISIPIAASGLRSALVLSAAQWLDASEVHWHQRAGILTLIVILVLGNLSGIILIRSRGGHKVGFVRLRRAILVLAIVSFGWFCVCRAWAANSGTPS